MSELTVEVIEKIQELLDPKVIEINGHQYCDKPIKFIDDPFRQQKPEAMYLNTLSSLIDYLAINKEGHNLDDLFIQIVDEKRIEVLEKFSGYRAERNIVAMATIRSEMQRFQFGRFLDKEFFMIGLQTRMKMDKNLECLLRFISTIFISDETKSQDDGITQHVTTKKGVHSIETTPVPNPVVLKPLRTFNEIEQPESPFIFRIKEIGKELQCALFDCDGGFWIDVATARIKAYLEGAFTERGINIPVFA